MELIIGLLLLMGEEMKEVDFDGVYFACTSPYELVTAVEVVREDYFPLPSGEDEVLLVEDGTPVEEYRCGFLPEAAVDFETSRMVVDEAGYPLTIYLVEEDFEMPIYQIKIQGQLFYTTSELPFDRHLVHDAVAVPTGTVDSEAAIARMREDRVAISAALNAAE